MSEDRGHLKLPFAELEYWTASILVHGHHIAQPSKNNTDIRNIATGHEKMDVEQIETVDVLLVGAGFASFTLLNR